MQGVKVAFSCSRADRKQHRHKNKEKKYMKERVAKKRKFQERKEGDNS